MGRRNENRQVELASEQQTKRAVVWFWARNQTITALLFLYISPYSTGTSRVDPASRNAIMDLPLSPVPSWLLAATTNAKDHQVTVSRYVGLKIAPNRVVSRVELPWVDFDRVDSPALSRSTIRMHFASPQELDTARDEDSMRCVRRLSSDEDCGQETVATSPRTGRPESDHGSVDMCAVHALDLREEERRHHRTWQRLSASALACSSTPSSQSPPSLTALTMANAGAGDLGGGGIDARAAASDNASIAWAEAGVEFARISRRAMNASMRVGPPGSMQRSSKCAVALRSICTARARNEDHDGVDPSGLCGAI
ncbi:hypothetical protein B0H11DRAFT_1904034 [Mycena galericulata]|nr:hypothetical protein B0H11DRAFT_1904034 [Mycena galericulata]